MPSWPPFPCLWGWLRPSGQGSWWFRDFRSVKLIPTVGGQHGPSKMRGEDGPVAAIFFEAWDVDRKDIVTWLERTRVSTIMLGISTADWRNLSY